MFVLLMVFVLIIVGASIAIFLIGAPFVAVKAARDANRQLEYRRDVLRKILELKLFDGQPEHEFFGADSQTALAVNDINKTLVLITISSGELTHRVISYRDLIAVSIEEDGNTITRVQRSSQIGGALLGGLALGGVGALIGGLSGATISSVEVAKLNLILIVNDLNRPIHTIFMLASIEGRRCKKTDQVYIQAMQTARESHALLTVVIRQADEQDGYAENKVHGSLINESKGHSVAEELEKLADLMSRGIITAAEFAQQKDKLLG